MRRTGGMRSIVPGRVTSASMARRDIDRLQGEVEELFADLWQVPRFSGIRNGFRPAVDCFFTEEPPQLVVVVELAGVDPDSIELAVEQRALTISGSRLRPRVPGQVYQQAEIEYGRFERRIPLEQDIDAGAANAAYEAGMLRVTLPVAERARAGSAVVIVVRRSA
jgi:HSP20 family protein